MGALYFYTSLHKLHKGFGYAHADSIALGLSNPWLGLPFEGLEDMGKERRRHTYSIVFNDTGYKDSVLSPLLDGISHYNPSTLFRILYAIGQDVQKNLGVFGPVHKKGAVITLGFIAEGDSLFTCTFLDYYIQVIEYFINILWSPFQLHFSAFDMSHGEYAVQKVHQLSAGHLDIFYISSFLFSKLTLLQQIRETYYGIHGCPYIMGHVHQEGTLTS